MVPGAACVPAYDVEFCEPDVWSGISGLASICLVIPLFLLATSEQGQVDPDLFDLAKRELSKITGTDQSPLDWDAARTMAARLRMEV